MMLLVYAWLLLLAVLVVAGIVSIIVLGSEMVRKDREKEAAMQQAAKEQEIAFDGMDRWEMNRIVNRLLREERKRQTRRMEWRMPNV